MANGGFLQICEKLRDRNFGGTNEGMVAEPYISGWQYTKWILPSGFTEIQIPSTADGANGMSVAQAANVLAATCTSFTPPGGTLESAEFNALAGAKYSVPTTVTYGNSITAKFVEFSGLPILRILHSWVNMIRDNKSGLTKLQGAEYIKSKYAGSVLYWTTKPDGKTVEFAAAYNGVFPKKDPQDLFPGDIASVDKVEIDCEFNCDFVYQEDWVYNAAKAEAEKIAGNNTWDGDRKKTGPYHGGTDFGQ